MIPTLSQVCSLPSSFANDVEEYAAGKLTSLEVWLTKLETYLQQHSRDDLRRLLDRFEMRIPVASYQGGLLAAQDDARREAWELFQRRLALCGNVGIETLIVACDMQRPVTAQSLDGAYEALSRIAREAADSGCRVALEFQADSTFANNLQTTAALVAEIGRPSLGICLDVFHYYIGPSKGEDLGYLHRGNLFHVQLSDLSDVPRELASDSVRILPGDGDIPLAPILDHLRAIGYDGPVSVELMNPRLWQVPPRQFGEIALTALRKVLGAAS